MNSEMRYIFVLFTFCITNFVSGQNEVDTFFMESNCSQGTVIIQDTTINFPVPLYFVDKNTRKPITGIIQSKCEDSQRIITARNGILLKELQYFKRFSSLLMQSIETRNYVKITRNVKKRKKESFKCEGTLTIREDQSDKKVIFQVRIKNYGEGKFVKTYYSSSNKQRIIETFNKEKLVSLLKEMYPQYIQDINIFFE